MSVTEPKSRARKGGRSPSIQTRAQLKMAAQLLFAHHGVNAVTVQQIVAAAGQKNNAAIHYHFGSKEELVREIVVDGAAVLERRRQEMLKELDAKGGPKTVRDVLHVLIMPVIELENEPQWRGYIRFTSHLHASDREALARALDNRWNSGYVACFDHLKKMVKISSKLLDQRLSLLNIYANAVLSARDAALEDSKTAQSRLWGQRFTLENILDSLEAALVSAPSESTRDLL